MRYYAVTKRRKIPPCPSCHKVKDVVHLLDVRVGSEMGGSYRCGNVKKGCNLDFWMAYMMVQDYDMIIEGLRKTVEEFEVKI